MNYDNAKTTYNEALKLKADEQYPKDQIALIDKKLQEIAEENERKNQQKKQYEEEIVKADQFFKEEKWDEAIESYTKAEQIKPDESYPKQMIEDINLRIQHLASIENEKRLRYDESIKKADAAFNEQSWKLAKQYYNDALAVYESEKYPADQLVLIDAKIQEQEQEKLAIEQKNQQFDALLIEGDQLLVF